MREQIKSLGKETLIYGASTVAARLLNFCLVPFYTYYLAAAEYGAVSTVFSVIALCYVLYLFGLDQAYLRFASDTEDKKKVFLHSLYGILICGVILSAVIYCFSGGIAALFGMGAERGDLLKITVPILLLDSFNMLSFTKLRLERRAARFAFTRVLSIVINVIFNIIFVVYFKAGIKGILWANVIASGASLLLLLPVTFEELKGGCFIKIEKALSSQMLKYAFPLVPGGIAAIMVNVIDKPILNHIVGLANVGVYQANFKMGVFMMLLVSMFDQAWRPFFLQHAKEENAKELYSKVFSVFTAFTLWAAMGLAFLLPVIIKTPVAGFYLLHPSYWGGLNIIPFVLAGYFFYGLYVNFMVAPVLTKKTSVLLCATLAGAAVSIGVNLLLAPKIGITAAGLAIMLSYITMAVILFIFLQKNYPIRYQYRRLGAVALTAVICCLANYFLNSTGMGARLGPKILLLLIFPFISIKALGIKIFK